MVKLSMCIEVLKEGGDYIHMFGHICVSTAQYKLRYFTQDYKILGSSTAIA